MKAKLYLLFFFVQLITAMEIEISITNQELTLKDNGEIVRIYKKNDLVFQVFIFFMSSRLLVGLSLQTWTYRGK